MSQLSTFYPAPITAADLGLGPASNATFGSIQNTPIGNTTPNSGAFTTLAANSTVTASEPALDLTQTWNNAAVAFRGVNWSFVETAASSASEVLRISTGAAGTNAIFNIRRDGNATFANGVNVGTIGGSAGIAGQGLGWRVGSNGHFGFTNMANNAYGTRDVQLLRDDAGVLAQQNGTNPQTFRLYNTFTDASNYERGFISWVSNTLRIGTEKAGTGSARVLRFQTDGTDRLHIGTNGFVGIGTTNPGSVLEVAGSDSNTRLRVNRSGNVMEVAVGASGDGLITATQGFTFFSGNPLAARFKILADGKVGIGLGASNPNREFHMLGGEMRLQNALLSMDNGTTSPCGAIYCYNTLSGSTSYERAYFNWDSNHFVFSTEAGAQGGTLRGIKLGSATSSLLGFYGATPVDQPATVADPAGGGTVDTEARTAIGEVIDRLQELGLIA